MNYNINISEWRVAASIDFITIAFPPYLKDERDAYEFQKNIKGTIAVPRKSRKADWLTIHDPTIGDLQYLIDQDPGTEILALEIAVDFRRADGSNDRAKLLELHGWLKQCLHPQHHSRIKKARRKYYEATTGKIKPDNLKTRSGNETVYWSDRTHCEQVRLYVKDIDAHLSEFQHSTRLEVTLSRGGSQLADVHRVWMLPSFFDGARRYLTPFLKVARGIKPNIKRSRATRPDRVAAAAKQAEKERATVQRKYERYGAPWAARTGYSIIPDKAATKLIGVALAELRKDVMRLKLPKKVVENPAWMKEQLNMYQVVGEPEKQVV